MKLFHWYLLIFQNNSELCVWCVYCVSRFVKKTGKNQILWFTEKREFTGWSAPSRHFVFSPKQVHLLFKISHRKKFGFDWILDFLYPTKVLLALLHDQLSVVRVSWGKWRLSSNQKRKYICHSLRFCMGPLEGTGLIIINTVCVEFGIV